MNNRTVFPADVLIAGAYIAGFGAPGFPAARQTYDAKGAYLARGLIGIRQAQQAQFEKKTSRASPANRVCAQRFLRMLFRRLFGYRHPHHGPSAIPGRDVHSPVTHHGQPLADVCQRDMGRVVLGRLEAGAVVLHGDFAARIRLSGTDEYAQRFGIRVQAVLDGVFHDGLQRRCSVSGGRWKPVWGVS